MKALKKPLFILSIVVFAALMVAIATQAQAQMVCGKRADMVEDMRQIYGEVRRGYGVSTNEGSVFEVWASDVTGTWTILKTTPNGLTCVMAVGTGWHDDAGELTPTGDPA